jgi:tetratricopeptide (TPR) repeat protein
MQVRKSIEYLQRALDAFQTNLAAEVDAEDCKLSSPRDSLDVASCYHQLGLAHALQESYGKACTAVEQALEIRGRLVGWHSPLTARTLDAVGRIYTLRGDYQRALTYHEQALTVFSQAGLSPVTTLEHMAAVYTAQGDWTGVVHMYVQIVYYLKSNWIVQPAPVLLKKGLEELAQAYEKVGESRYADDCRQEAELLG